MMADLGPLYGLFHFHYREVEQSTSSVWKWWVFKNVELSWPYAKYFFCSEMILGNPAKQQWWEIDRKNLKRNDGWVVPSCSEQRGLLVHNTHALKIQPKQKGISCTSTFEQFIGKKNLT